MAIINSIISGGGGNYPYGLNAKIVHSSNITYHMSDFTIASGTSTQTLVPFTWENFTDINPDKDYVVVFESINQMYYISGASLIGYTPLMSVCRHTYNWSRNVTTGNYNRDFPYYADNGKYAQSTLNNDYFMSYRASNEYYYATSINGVGISSFGQGAVYTQQIPFCKAQNVRIDYKNYSSNVYNTISSYLDASKSYIKVTSTIYEVDRPTNLIAENKFYQYVKIIDNFDSNYIG